MKHISKCELCDIEFTCECERGVDGVHLCEPCTGNVMSTIATNGPEMSEQLSHTLLYSLIKTEVCTILDGPLIMRGMLMAFTLVEKDPMLTMKLRDEMNREFNGFLVSQGKKMDGDGTMLGEPAEKVIKVIHQWFEEHD